MEKKIKAIDQQTIHSICSGQVVLDLATAVKELVENSIDAGASSVEIRFKENGVKGLEVIDNGSGVNPENYNSLALKHYTSKISVFEDVERVETFGFRGEALSSLCSLSQLTVITCTKDQTPMGVKLEYDENGILVSNTTVSRPAGTTVQLSDLFRFLPVRQKEFKRNCKKEYGKALAILQAYSIISTNVKISVFNQSDNKKTTSVMSTAKNKNMVDNILNIYGSKIVSQIMPFQVNLEDSKGCIEGFISKPEWGVGRSSLDRQHFFVNGRPCILPKMASTFNELYRSFISNQYPLIIADFKIPTNAYDVNVSPDKRTIFIHEEKKITEAITEQLRQLMEPSRSTFQTNSLMREITGLDQKEKEGSSLSRETVHPEREVKNQISLQSFVSAEGSAYKPKTTKRLLKTQAGERGNDISIREFLSKRLKTVDKTETDDKTMSTEKNELMSVEEDELMSTGEDELKNTKEVGLTSTNDNETIDTEETESTVIEENILEQETAIKIEKSTIEICSQKTMELLEQGQENNVTLDEQQYFEKEKEIKTLGALSKTTGCVMTIHTNDPSSLIPFSETDENTDPLTDKTNTADFFSNAGIQNMQDNEKAAEALNRVIHKSDFKRMKVLGQFNLGFIIALLDQDLYIIDQHASDEKYNFETLPKTVRVGSQQLIRPQTPALTAAEELIVMDHLDVFRLNGFDVKVLPENEPTCRIQVLSQPVTKKAMFDEKDFSELIFLLNEHPDEIVRCSRNRAIFASMACHKAVRIGQPLIKSKMIKIIQNMGEIDQPWNCPHGRPSMRHLMSLSHVKSKANLSKPKLTFRGSLFQ